MHFKHPLVSAVNHMAALTFREEKENKKNESPGPRDGGGGGGTPAPSPSLDPPLESFPRVDSSIAFMVRMILKRS